MDVLPRMYDLCFSNVQLPDMTDFRTTPQISALVCCLSMCSLSRCRNWTNAVIRRPEFQRCQLDFFREMLAHRAELFADTTCRLSDAIDLDLSPLPVTT